MIATAFEPTAVDAIAMCLVSACLGAGIVVAGLLIWIHVQTRLHEKRTERQRRADRTILHRI